MARSSGKSQTAGNGEKSTPQTLVDLSSQIASLESQLLSVVTAEPGTTLWADQVDDKSWIRMELDRLKAQQSGG
jgi:hypothetical protein